MGLYTHVLRWMVERHPAHWDLAGSSGDHARHLRPRYIHPCEGVASRWQVRGVGRAPAPVTEIARAALLHGEGTVVRTSGRGAKESGLAVPSISAAVSRACSITGIWLHEPLADSRSYVSPRSLEHRRGKWASLPACGTSRPRSGNL